MFWSGSRAGCGPAVSTSRIALSSKPLPAGDVDKAVLALEKVRDDVGYEAVQSETGLVKVSVIGIGMRSHAGVAATAFKALAEKGINIRAITTSEIKISILIDGPYCELAVRTLHNVYGLDKL